MRLIDADALLKKLGDSIWYNVMDFNEAWYAVNHAPPVDAVPVRHGRWIIRTRHEHYPSGRAYEEIVCPFCGKVDHNGDGNFCGYCGARMDGLERTGTDKNGQEDGDHAEGSV